MHLICINQPSLCERQLVVVYKRNVSDDDNDDDNEGIVIFLEAVTRNVLQKKLLLKYRNIHRKTPVLESLFNEVAVLKACNFIMKRLQYRCFSVKNAKFLRTPILKNIFERLLLYFIFSSSKVIQILNSVKMSVEIILCFRGTQIEYAGGGGL